MEILVLGAICLYIQCFCLYMGGVERVNIHRNIIIIHVYGTLAYVQVGREERQPTQTMNMNVHTYNVFAHH